MAARRSSLDSFFRPRTVAVFGAGAKAGSLVDVLIRNLMENPFGGTVYLIDPAQHSVQGVQYFPTLASVPEKVELAVIATPPASAPSLVRDCVEHGVAAAVISADFAELDAEGRKLEDEVRGIARGKTRIVGPNSLGILHPPSNLNASFAASMAPRGRVALLSQSGAICTAILDWARQAHVGFSSFVSVGSMLDVDFADLIDYFADDPDTRSIVLYMESIGDVRKFLSAARSISRTKHVIVVKAGRHEAGADAVFDAAFRRAGVLRVTTIPDLFDMADILAMQPPPRGPSLAIITNAGGPGVMAADALMLGKGQLASLHPETLAALNASLPSFWSHANPIDILGDAAPQRYRLAVEACGKDPNVQGILVLLTPQAMTDPTETARQIQSFARLPNKPLLACWMGGESVRDGIGLLNKAGIPTFNAPEPAIRAFLHMVQYCRNQELLYETPEALPENDSPDTPRVRHIFDHVRASGRTLLNEVESKEVLAAYGVPITTAMDRQRGYELIISSSIDRQFGPVIAFGSSGILAQILEDRALGLPPLNRTLARRLMERTKIYEALRGVRVQGAVNLEALETLLVHFSQLLVDFQEIQEVALNPVLATTERVIVLNARLLLCPADRPTSQYPRLAIPPYPNRYIAHFRLRDGREEIVRPIRPEDEALIIALHASHSEHTIRMRFFSMVKTLSRDSLIRLCHLDYDREMALTAVLHEDGEPLLLGISRYYLNPETGTAEFALVVRDA